MRRIKPVAFTLGAALLGAAAHAQVTYSYAFPQIPANIVAQFSGSTAPTGGDPTFNAPAYNTSGLSNPLPPPNALLTTIGTTQTLYRTKNFTITSAGTYNVTVAGTLTNASGLQGIIYRNSFNPASPLSNLVQQVQGATSGTPTAVGVNLDPGNYVFVVSPLNNGAAGPFNVSITQVYAPFFTAVGSTVPPGASPQFNRPTANGNLPPVTAAFGANYAYKADNFTVPTDGPYQIYSDETSPNLYQGQLNLYQGSFDPANPLVNCIQVSGNNTNLGAPRGSSKLIANLKAGVQYILVTNNFLNGVSVQNDYVNTVKPLTVAPLDTWSGTTVGAPTFNRPAQPAANNGLMPTALSGVNAAYDAHTFTSSVSGKITVTSTCVAPASWNNYLVIYQDASNPSNPNSFNPSRPLANVLYAADGGYNNAITNYTVTQGFFNSVVSISFNAVAGQTYTFVTTGNTTTSAGSYTGSVTQDQDPNSGTAVATLSGSLLPGTLPTPYYQKPFQNFPTTKAPAQISAAPVPYSVDQFTITTEGNYNIVDATTVPTSWGLYFILYKDSFDATQPLANIYQDPTNSVYQILGSDNEKAILPVHLTPGTYYAVTSSFGQLAYGDYKLTVQQAVSGAAPITFADTLNAGTGTTFTRPNAGTAPLTLSTLTTSKNDFYDAKTFTVPTTAAYNIDAIANPNGTDIYGTWNDFVVLYQGAFNPASPLTNALAANDSINLFGTDAGLRNVTLTAGTTYTLVVAGSSFNQFGSYRANVYTGGGAYPPLIPDNTPAGLAAVNNVTDTFTVLGLNSVTITGLYHPRAGDLVATLSHAGVTIELTDRLGRTTSGSTGSGALFFGDYTFAPVGSDLGAVGTPSGGIDATQTYAPYLNGTAFQSATYTGDFTAFNGKSASGPWTLTISDLNSGSVGYFSGFSFNVAPSTGPLTINVALEGTDVSNASAYAPLGTFHVSLRAPGSQTESFGYDVTIDTSSSTLTIPNAVTGTYDVWVKGSKNLAVLAQNVAISTAGATVASAAAPLLLPAGDANNDNSVDSSDFGILIGVFNTDASVTGSGYDPTADFNFDGAVDSSDFGLLIGEFNNAGAL